MSHLQADSRYVLRAFTHPSPSTHWLTALSLCFQDTRQAIVRKSQPQNVEGVVRRASHSSLEILQLLISISGHGIAECTANRIFHNFANLGIKDLSAQEAWEDIVTADKDKDVDDMKKACLILTADYAIRHLLTIFQAILAYAKAYKDLTLPELEAVFRENEMNIFLIAKTQEVAKTHTIVNLQGQIDQTYALSIQLSAKPRRAKFAEGWPESAEDNMTRLAEAGFIMDRLAELCSNCNGM